MAEWPINLSQAAERLGIAKSTLSAMVVGAAVPTQRIGQSVCLDEAAFEVLRQRAQRLPGKKYNRPKSRAVSTA